MFSLWSTFKIENILILENHLKKKKIWNKKSIKYKLFFDFLAFFMGEEESDFGVFLLLPDLLSFFFWDSEDSFFCRLFLVGGSSSSSSLSDNSSNNFSSNCNCCSKKNKTKQKKPLKEFFVFNIKNSSIEINKY